MDNAKDHNNSIIEKALKRAFSPEFLNRIDDIVIFNNLDKNDLTKIIDIEMSSLLSRIKKLGYNVKISKKAKDFICERGYDSKFGARPLKRAIQKYFEDPLSEKLLVLKLKKGDNINVNISKDKSCLEIKINNQNKKQRKNQKNNINYS